MIDYKLKYIIRYENIYIYIYLYINTNTIHVDFLLNLIFIVFNVYLFISNE